MNRYVLVEKLLDLTRRPIKIHLDADEVLVGTRSITSLSKYPAVSVDHALFLRTSTGNIYVKNTKGSNGLYVNGVKIGTTIYELSVGDSIGFGVPSIYEGSGFVCVLEIEVVEIEVIDLTEDESENEAGISSATNSNSGISGTLAATTSLEQVKQILLPKRKKRVRKLSDSSNDSNDENVTNFINAEENDSGSVKNDMTKNAAHKGNKIRILDALSYLHTLSYVSTKQISPDVQNISHQNADALCKEIFGDGSLPSVSCIQEDDDYVETVEDIAEFIRLSEPKKCLEKVGSESDEPEIMVLDQKKNYTSIVVNDDLILQLNESDDDEDVSEPCCSVQLPLGDSIIQTSLEQCTMKAKEDTSLNYAASKEKTVKSIGRALYTDPKPLNQRRRNMRGDKSLNISPKKIGKKSAASVEVQSDSINSSLKNFKIPKKADVRSNIKQLNENQPSTSAIGASNANNRYNASAAKKVSSVKTRPQKLGSRVNFWLEESEKQLSKIGKL